MNYCTSIPTQALAGSALPSKPKGSAPLASRKRTRTSASCSPRTGPACQTLVPSRTLPRNGWESRRDALMCLRGGCLASLRVLSDRCAVLLMSVGNGPQQSDWWAYYDPASQSLRTRQHSLLSKEGEPGTELCQDWSRSGMICGGMYFPLPRLVQDICESASSSSLPTPRASANESRQTKLTPSQLEGTPVRSLQAEIVAKLLPTPTARDWKDTPGMARTATDGRERDDQLPRRIFGAVSPAPTGGMRLTPEFQCWLMGFPPDWLKPLRAVPATQLCRKSSNRSRGPSAKRSKGAK